MLDLSINPLSALVPCALRATPRKLVLGNRVYQREQT
jgi:hypothetical protein